MSQKITSRTFSASKEDRDNYRPARGTRLFAEAVAETETCVATLALKLGMSESMLRKILRGDLQFPLMDIAELAAVDTRLFAVLLTKLAALDGKILVDRNDNGGSADRLARAASVAKEGGEAIAAIVQAEIHDDHGADIAAIREGEEAMSKIGSAVAAAKGRVARHLELVRRPARSAS